MNNLSLKNKPILFLINGLGLGGAEKIFVSQINTLNDMGLTVYLGTLYDRVPEKSFSKNLTIPAANFISFGFKTPFDVKGLLRLRDFISGKKVSVIYSTLEEANIVSRSVKLIKPGVKVVIRESSGNAGNKLFKFKLLDICLNFFADKIIAVSHGVKLSLAGYQKIHSHKLVVLENGVAVPRIKLNSFFDKKDKDRIKILSVGSLVRRNNHVFLLEAFCKLIKKLSPKTTLIIVGGGPLKDELGDYVLKNELMDYVILTGPINHNDLEYFYMNSHIFILPSMWEGSPNALLEAMSYGLPPISSKIDGAVDIIEDGVSGFLVNINDTNSMQNKILQLVSDEKLRYDVGLAAQERIRKNYSLEKNVNSLIQILS